MSAVASSDLAIGFDADDIDEDSDYETPSDVRLMEHNQRFQAAVLRSMEKQLGAMENKIFDKDAELFNNERAREDLGIWFGQMKVSLEKLQAKQKKSETRAQQSDHDRKVAVTEKETTIKKNAVFEKQLKCAEHTVAALTSSSKDKDAQIEQFITLQKAWFSDLKMHRQLKENYDMLIEKSANETKLAQDVTAEWQKQFEKSENTVQSLIQEHESVEMELKKSYLVVEQLLHELQALQATSFVKDEQLAKAQEMMAKRDKVMKKIHADRLKAQDETKTLIAVQARLAKDNNALQYAAETGLVEGEKTLQQMHDLQAKMTSLESSMTTLKEEKQHQSLEHARIKEEFDTLQKQHNQNLINYEVSTTNEKRLRAQLQLHRQKHGAFVADVDVDKIISTKTIDQLKQEFAKGMRDVKFEFTMLKNEKAKQELGRVEAEQQTKDTTASYNTLEKGFEDLIGQYTRVCEENLKLERRMGGAQYHANKAQSECKQQAEAASAELEHKTTQLRLEVADLTKIINKKTSELHTLEKAFFKTQEDLLRRQTEVLAIEEANKTLLNKLTLESVFHQRAHKEEQEKDRAVKRAFVESDLLKCEIDRVTRRNEKLATEQTNAKEVLATRAMQFQENEMKYQRDIDVLKAKLARAQADRESDNKLEIIKDSEMGRMVLERKVEFLMQKNETLIAQMDDLSKIRFELAAKLRESEKSRNSSERAYTDWQNQFQNMMEKGMKQRERDHSSRYMSVTAPPPGAGATASPREFRMRNRMVGEEFKGRMDSGSIHTQLKGSQTVRGQKEANIMEHVIEDLRLRLNRANTIAAERLNELIKTQQQSEMKKAVYEQSKQLAESVVQDKSDWEQEKVSVSEKMRQLKSRYVRLESIAASLECQIEKEVDYGYFPDMEPSLQLKAALESTRVANGRSGRRKKKDKNTSGPA